jgi:hypothetical protein
LTRSSATPPESWEDGQFGLSEQAVSYEKETHDGQPDRDVMSGLEHFIRRGRCGPHRLVPVSGRVEPGGEQGRLAGRPCLPTVPGPERFLLSLRVKHPEHTDDEFVTRRFLSQLTDQDHVRSGDDKDTDTQAGESADRDVPRPAAKDPQTCNHNPDREHNHETLGPHEVGGPGGHTAEQKVQRAPVPHGSHPEHQRRGDAEQVECLGQSVAHDVRRDR